MTVLDRKLITRMVNPQPGGNGGGGGAGGAGAYVLPAASNSELGGIKLGYPTGTGKFYPVQLDSQQRAYVDVPWTDHYAWGDITNKPDFATVATSGSYNDLNNKPSIPSVSGSVSGSTLTITINGTAYSLTDTNTWRPLGTGATDAAAGNHLHDDRYLKLSGGTMTGQLSINKVGYALKWNNDNYSVGSNNSPNDFYIWSEDSTARFRLGTNNLERLTVLANGNIGIGTTSPSYKLHVEGTIYATGSVTALSDARKKRVLGDIVLSAEQIAQMPAVRFEWKDPKKPGMFIGTLAQNWREILPEAVHTIDDGTLSFDYQSAAIVGLINLADEIVSIKNKLKRYGFK